MEEMTIVELQGEHTAWVNELVHAKDMLGKDEQQLMLAKSVLDKKTVEHFQNQFLIQKKNIDTLKNEIKMHELSLLRSQRGAFASVNGHDADYHRRVEDKVMRLLDVVDEIRGEFLDMFIT